MRITAIIPCRNARAYLPDAIESVVAQTRRPNELIVVDNGSTDGTEELIGKTYAGAVGDGWLRYLRNEEDRGVAFSRNRAVGVARGGWVAFLDADDRWRPDHLELVCGHVEKGGQIDAVLVPPSMLIDAAGRSAGRVVFDGDRWTALEAVLLMKAVCPTGLVVKRDVYLSVGGMEKLEEILFLFKVVASGRTLVFLDAGTTFRRIHGGQTMAGSIGERSGRFLEELDLAYGRMLGHEAVKNLRPAVLARIFIALGEHHLYRGSTSKGRAYLLTALRKDPRSWVSVRVGKLWVKSILPKWLWGPLKRLLRGGGRADAGASGVDPGAKGD